MLSKPSLTSSAGSSALAIDMQPQNVLDRIRVLGPIQPVHRHASGIGVCCRGLSSEFSSHVAKASTAARSGWRAPGGGIMPPRSFRTALSQIFASFDEIRQIHRVEHDVRCFGALVVAGDAVLVEKRSLSRSRRR